MHIHIPAHEQKRLRHTNPTQFQEPSREPSQAKPRRAVRWSRNKNRNTPHNLETPNTSHSLTKSHKIRKDNIITIPKTKNKNKNKTMKSQSGSKIKWAIKDISLHFFIIYLPSHPITSFHSIHLMAYTYHALPNQPISIHSKIPILPYPTTPKSNYKTKSSHPSSSHHIKEKKKSDHLKPRRIPPIIQFFSQSIS